MMRHSIAGPIPFGHTRSSSRSASLVLSAHSIAAMRVGSKASLQSKRSNPLRVKLDLDLQDSPTNSDDSQHTEADTVLPERMAKRLLEMTVEDMQRTLAEFLELRKCGTDLREASLLDCYTGAVWWAKGKGFSARQTSTFFITLHTLVQNLLDKNMGLVENMLELRKMLAGIGSQWSGCVVSGDLEVFTERQTNDVCLYVFCSLFQHYRLYQCVLREPQQEDIITRDLEMETPTTASLPFPPPMDEGIDGSQFDAFLARATPSSAEDTEDRVEEETPMADISLDEDLMSHLTAEEVREVVASVTSDVLTGLQHEVAVVLREKENQLLARINKLHVVLRPSDSPQSLHH